MKPYIAIRTRRKRGIVVPTEELSQGLVELRTIDAVLEAHGRTIPMHTQIELEGTYPRWPFGDRRAIVPLEDPHDPPAIPGDLDAELHLAADARDLSIRSSDCRLRSVALDPKVLAVYLTPTRRAPYHARIRCEGPHSEVCRAIFEAPLGRGRAESGEKAQGTPLDPLAEVLFQGEDALVELEISEEPDGARVLLVRYLEPRGPLAIVLPLKIPGSKEGSWRPCSPYLVLDPSLPGSMTAYPGCLTPEHFEPLAELVLVPQSLVESVWDASGEGFLGAEPSKGSTDAPVQVTLIDDSDPFRTATAEAEVMWPADLYEDFHK